MNSVTHVNIYTTLVWFPKPPLWIRVYCFEGKIRTCRNTQPLCPYSSNIFWVCWRRVSIATNEDVSFSTLDDELLGV